MSTSPAFSSPDASGLRIALFSGNYNYVKDGANQALNRLVGWLETHGAQVRVYSPTAATPAFAPTGTLISVPSLPIPRRPEYRIALGLPEKIRADLVTFRPNLFHLSCPDFLGHAALRLAHRWQVPAVASVHTRFETYPRYYGLGALEPGIIWLLRRYYNRCAQIYAPSESMAAELRALGMGRDVRRWTRGVETDLFHPDKRDLSWRQSYGIRDEEVVIAFAGRLVLEKGLGIFAQTLQALRARGVPHRALVVGDGPEREWFAQQVPGAVFTGFVLRDTLAKAYASADIFFNPSVTETFGNVTLEAMAAGLPTVCAAATGANSLVVEGQTGFLRPLDQPQGFIDALETLCRNPGQRAAMGVAGRTASLAYEWDAVMQELLDHYRTLVPGDRAVLA